MRLNWGCEMVRDRSDGYRPHVSNSVGSQRPSRPPGREGRSGSISTISSDPRTPCVARNHARPAHRLCIPIVFAHGRWRSGQRMLATWPASARRGPLPRAASTRGRSVATREPITAGAKGRCCHSCASPPPKKTVPIHRGASCASRHRSTRWHDRMQCPKTDGSSWTRVSTSWSRLAELARVQTVNVNGRRVKR